MEQSSSGPAPPSFRIAWELVGLARASLTSLEEQSTRVVAAEAAGLIALWTQLSTFDGTVPAALAWTALFVLVVSVSLLARLVRPKRLARFWEHAALESTAADEGLPEQEIVSHIGETLRRQELVLPARPRGLASGRHRWALARRDRLRGR